MGKQMTAEEIATRDERRAAQRAKRDAQLAKERAATAYAVLDWHNTDTFGGLIGQWDIELYGPKGEQVTACITDFRGALEFAVDRGVSPVEVHLTPNVYKSGLRPLGWWILAGRALL